MAATATVSAATVPTFNGSDAPSDPTIAHPAASPSWIVNQLDLKSLANYRGSRISQLLPSHALSTPKSQFLFLGLRRSKHPASKLKALIVLKQKHKHHHSQLHWKSELQSIVESRNFTLGDIPKLFPRMHEGTDYVVSQIKQAKLLHPQTADELEAIYVVEPTDSRSNGRQPTSRLAIEVQKQSEQLDADRDLDAFNDLDASNDERIEEMTETVSEPPYWDYHDLALPLDDPLKLLEESENYEILHTEVPELRETTEKPIETSFEPVLLILLAFISWIYSF